MLKIILVDDLYDLDSSSALIGISQIRENFLFKSLALDSAKSWSKISS